MPKFLKIMYISLLTSFFAYAIYVKADDSLKVFLNFEKLVFEENEDIFLHINIRNNSDRSVPFSIYDAEYVTFMPVVYDMTGNEVETLVNYRLSDKKTSEILKSKQPRIISIGNNEVFSHIINLRKIYKIDSDKEYRVKVILSPDAKAGNLIAGENTLTFKVVRGNNLKTEKIERVRRFISPERKFSPSEIILLFLKAEKDYDWDNYFKYIAIEKYINAYPEYTRIYDQAVARNDIALKEKIIIEFIKFLKEKRNDYILSYKVTEELIKNEHQYFVDAIVKRKSLILNKPYIYKYRYSLDKYDNLWVITGIEATVIKENQYD